MSIVRQATVTLIRSAELLVREALKRLVRKGSGFVVVEAGAPGNYVAFTLRGGSVCFFNTLGYEGPISLEEGAKIAIELSVAKTKSGGIDVDSIVVRESTRLHPIDDEVGCDHPHIDEAEWQTLDARRCPDCDAIVPKGSQ